MSARPIGIGRIVHFVRRGVNGRLVERAAIVVTCSGPTDAAPVELQIFNSGADNESIVENTTRLSRVEHSTEPRERTWHWADETHADLNA